MLTERAFQHWQDILDLKRILQLLVVIKLFYWNWKVSLRIDSWTSKISRMASLLFQQYSKSTYLVTWKLRSFNWKMIWFMLLSSHPTKTCSKHTKAYLQPTTQGSGVLLPDFSACFLAHIDVSSYSLEWGMPKANLDRG